MGLRSITANHTAPPFIWPKTVKPFCRDRWRLARNAAFSTPAIHHADLHAGFLITEDFGSASFIEGDPPEPIAERYQAATDLLAALATRESLPV